MSRVVFYTAANMKDFMLIPGGEMTDFSSSIVQISLSPYVGIYSGSFTWSGDNLTGGTVTGYRLYANNVLQYDVSALHVSALAIKSYFETGNALGLQQLVLAGNDTLVGSALNDTLVGWGGNDFLAGDAGNDTLDGKTGADTMDGGTGDDFYEVDTLSDVVSDIGGQDTVRATLATGTYTLPTGIENLTLGGSAAINAQGNGAANSITGNAGANTLDGGAGADTLAGGKGNDVYIVDSPGDIVLEGASAGIDTVRSSISHTLASNVENLILTGTGNIDAGGNALANTLIGNDGNNSLTGDIGADTLRGGKGDDSYSVDLVASGTGAARIARLEDTIIENAGEGNDRVFLAANPLGLTVASTLTLGANLEYLNIEDTVANRLNITGNALDNYLVGNDADNTIDGGKGADTMLGNGGDDTFIVDNANDLTHEAYGAGIDTVRVAIGTAGGSYTLEGYIERGILVNNVAFTLFGSGADNTLIGNAAANTLVGGYGNDTLDGKGGVDVLDGGDDNDTYIIDTLTDTILDSGGVDTVIANLAAGSYTLASGLENLTLGGIAPLKGVGNAAANIITGNDGANILDGGANYDLMVGGKGNDTYLVDNTSDWIIEVYAGTAGGTDTVISSVSFSLSLADNVENLTLTGSSDAEARGNSLANILVGNDGDNRLIGYGGADTLRGGNGDDRYEINVIAAGGTASLEDTVIEAAGGGRDSITLNGSGVTLATATTLLLPQNVEVFDAYYTGTVPLNLTGNALDNYIVGNTAANVIDGGAGADTMVGLGGDDTYVVDNVGDAVSEATGEGIDTVRLGIAIAGGQYTAGSNIENVTLTHTLAHDLTGNTLNNALTGNAAVNTLTGGDGDDVLSGAAGNDRLLGGNGNDTLDGGSGTDSLDGGLGNDTFVVDTLSDIIADAGGSDTVIANLAAGSYTLASGLENLTLGGIAALNGFGNGSNNTLIGNDGANTLDGGLGVDLLKGGKGNDIYIVDDIGDLAVEDVTGAAGGIDTVRSSMDYTLGANLENLTLTGNNVIGGNGNALANNLQGNDAANALWGMGGNDTIKGGKGDDSYYVNVVVTGSGASAVAKLEDTLIENAGEGQDRLVLVTYGPLNLTTASTITLAANIETLEANYTGSDKLNFLGNASNNTFIGNDADNVINGGAGADRMEGWIGNDTYILDNIGDSVLETPGGGTDTVKIGFGAVGGTYTLGSDVENGVLTNTVSFNLTGNSLDNALTGNAAANTLDGSLGADSMAGGKGNDVYIVDNINDLIVEAGTEGGIDTVKSSLDYTLGANLENLVLTGADSIEGYGNNLANIVTGNSGNNWLVGNGGVDTLIGGTGNDTYFVNVIASAGTAKLEDKVVEKLNEGSDTLRLVTVGNLGLTGAATIFLPENLENLYAYSTGTNLLNFTGNAADNFIVANDAANVLHGWGGNDFLSGGKGNDVLNGMDGNDYLFGGMGNDRLSGGDGNDTLIGASEMDTLTGGNGDDGFVFIDLAGTDQIQDFTHGDKLLFDYVFFADLAFTGAGGTLDPSMFALGASATTANQHIIFNSTAGTLYYDPDGSGAQAQVALATFVDLIGNLAATDIAQFID